MIIRIKVAIFFFSFLSAEVYDGMTLFSAYSDDPDEDEHYTRLIDNDENIIHSWTHDRGAASMSYLLKDSTLIYPYRIENPSMCNGGVGGGISLYNWNGDVLWNYEFSDDRYQHHHDIQPMPNGNILVLLWERHTATQGDDTEFYGGEGRGWSEMGRQEVQNPLNQMWSEAIFEIEMVGSDEINIVWEWHLWDHVIQDVDPDLPNYGIISEHPELMDINWGEVGDFDGMCGPQGDWIHFNAIDYNESLDQIALSSRHNSEIYIIDHSTTTEEAATHAGGNSHMGGDLLYRWGNPQVYGQGTSDDQKLDAQHGVNWIPVGSPGEGNLILFNNFHGDWQSLPVNDWRSAIYELVTPHNNEMYELNTFGTFDPIEPIWIYTEDFFSFIQSGVFRLPNGNTLITVTTEAKIFEVENNIIIWEYQLDDGQMIARSQKYPSDYLFSLSTNIKNIPKSFFLHQNYPNPFNPITVIPYSLEDDVNVKINIYDMLGTLVYDFNAGRQYVGNRSIEWNATNNSGQRVPAGIYFYKLNAGEQVSTKKMILLK